MGLKQFSPYNKVAMKPMSRFLALGLTLALIAPPSSTSFAALSGPVRQRPAEALLWQEQALIPSLLSAWNHAITRIDYVLTLGRPGINGRRGSIPISTARAPLAHPTDKALQIHSFLAHTPFLRHFTRLTPALADELRVFHKNSYVGMKEDSARHLSDEQRANWRAHYAEILGIPSDRINIRPGPAEHLINDEDGVWMIQESLPSTAHSVDIAHRDRIQAWIFGKRVTWLKLQKLYFAPMAFLFHLLGRLLGYRSQVDLDHFATALLNGMRFIGPYHALRLRFSKFHEIPGVPLEILLKTSKSTEPRDLDLIRQAFERAKKFYTVHGESKIYPSGESYFDHATRVAYRVARMGRGADAIAAALLHKIDDGDRKILEAEPVGDLFFTRRVLALINGLENLLAEPCRPRVREGILDYTVGNLMNRQIQLLDLEAEKILTDLDAEHRLEASARTGLRSAMRASLFCLQSADALQTIATVPENDQHTRDAIYTKIMLIDAPQAERLGLVVTGSLLRNEAFHAVEPQAYQTARTEIRQALNDLSDEEAESLLSGITEDAGRKVRELGVEPVTIRYRKKTEESASAKRDKTPIAEQPDLLALMVVTKDDIDFNKIQNLDQLLGVRLPRNSVRGKIRNIEHEGVIAYRLVTFEVPHPSRPGEVVPIELQVMTQSVYNNYLYGQDPVPYREAHWMLKLKRTARVIAARLLGKLKVNWMVRFNQQDPILATTGNLTSDLENNLDRLVETNKEFNYPIYPVDSDGNPLLADQISPNSYWDVERIAADSPWGDIALGPTWGGVLDHYPVGTLIASRVDPNRPEELALLFSAQEKLDIETSVPPAARLARSPEKRSIKLMSSLKTLADRLRLPQPRLALRRAMERRRMQHDAIQQENLLLENGRTRLETIFRRNGNTFDTEVLPEMAAWKQMSSVGEFIKAVGAGFIDLKSIQKWYQARYVTISTHMTELNNHFEVEVKLDENQVGILRQITEIVYAKGWDLIPGTKVSGQRLARGEIIIHLPIRPTNGQDIQILINAIQNLHLPRGLNSPVQNGRERFVRIDVTDQPGRLQAALGVIAKYGADITSVKAQRSRANPDLQTFELVLTGPDANDDLEAQETTEGLERELRALKARGAAVVQAFRLANIDDLVQFQFELIEEDDHIVLIETASENQIGVMKEIDDILMQQGWNHYGKGLHFRQILCTGDAAVEARIKLQRPEGPPEIVRQRMRQLQKAFADIHRFRGEHLSAATGSRATLHLLVADDPTAERVLLDEFENLGINIEQADIDRRPDENLQWWNLDITIPAQLQDRIGDILSRLLLSTDQPVILEKEILWDINDTAAVAVIHYLESLMNENVKRHMKYASWLKDKTMFPLDETKPLQPMDHAFLESLRRAIAIAVEYHAHATRSSDGSPYLVHLLEVTHTLVAYYGVRDPVTILAAILHDVIEDGQTEYLKAHPDFLTGELELARRQGVRAQIIRDIRAQFPGVQDKLLDTILAVTKGEGDSEAEYLGRIAERGRILLIALKLADREINIQDRRSDDRQDKVIADTLLNFLGVLSWEPGLANTIYRQSHRQFLQVLIHEVNKANWDNVISKIKDFPHAQLASDIQKFLFWMVKNPDCMPDVPNNERQKFANRLNSLLVRTDLQRSNPESNVPLESAA